MIARFLAGVALALAFVSAPAQTAKELEFQKGADELRAKWAAQFAALDERFGANEVSDAIAPENLVNADAIRRSREKLRVRLLLIEERGGVLKRYLDEAEVYFQTASVDNAVRQAAMQNAAATRPTTTKLHRELAAAEVSTLSILAEILDFAETRVGRTVAQNGKLAFASQDESKRYNELMSRLREAASREQRAFDAYVAFQQESRQHVEELKRRLP